MNIVVSDPKTRKAYSKKIDNPAVFIGKRMGEEAELGIIGLEGYTAMITGGSDKQGFPMKADLAGGNRREVYVVTDAKKGHREKISRRGHTVTDEIAQLNLKVVKEGHKKLDELLGSQNAEKKEQKVSIKEQMVKESLDNVGKISAEEAKLIKKSK
ncbi:MAG: 30S ribosomal protein S6e [Candidatus Diapherotrites archaeon]|uniref:30S ribosomal protein S6e n=1 Tax=Candidatus Iainarchaeum sp. TaxID=3101447 RepID=A0A8T3YN80_9ARCH|nr:30S ribosomal protein S6e [Candidatus Diapherotrites archaeon]